MFILLGPVIDAAVERLSTAIRAVGLYTYHSTMANICGLRVIYFEIYVQYYESRRATLEGRLSQLNAELSRRRRDNA